MRPLVSRILFFLVLFVISPELCHIQAQTGELEYAEELNRKVIELYQQGRYAEALPLAEQVLTIHEKELGEANPATAVSLNNLGLLHQSAGDWEKAESLYQKSLAITQAVYGYNHLNTATPLDNLGGLYDDMGEYDKALSYYTGALAIREKALGPEHPELATTLNNLGLLYYGAGQYEKASPMFERAIAIVEKSLGPEHPYMAASINNLAALNKAIGSYEEAEANYRNALAIINRSLGPAHPDAATAHNNLGELFQIKGDYEKALSHYKQALEIAENAYGLNHPYIATLQNNLGELSRVTGLPDSAESYFMNALEIRNEALGPEHPLTASSIHNLALLYSVKGDYKKAETLFQQASSAFEKAYGPAHPQRASALYNMAAAYASQGAYPKAHELHRKAQAISDILIENVMSFTDEKRKLQFLAAQRVDLELSVGLVVFHLKNDRKARVDALNFWLRRKGVVLESQKRYQDALLYGSDPQAIETFTKLASLRSRLSQLVFSGASAGNPDVYRRELERLQSGIAQLESELSRISEAFAKRKNAPEADARIVARALPKKSVLIEFVKIHPADYKAGTAGDQWKAARYVTFMLHAGNGDDVDIIDLGEAEQIENAIADFRKAVEDANDVKGTGAGRAAEKLYNLTFAKLKKELGQSTDIFISPDGALNLIPFEALRQPNGRYLIEDFTFNYLSSGRDVQGSITSELKTGPPLLMGDPDFDLQPPENQYEGKRKNDNAGEDVSGRACSREMRGFQFSPLPGTLKEIQMLGSLMADLEPRIYIGPEAVENVLSDLEAPPKIIHLATHGFFLTDVDFKEFAAVSAAERGRRPAENVQTPNPLLRSGIVLAGANYSLNSNTEERSDGLVTAEKILGLRLKGSRLVVLSACETGVGDVRIGEGVFGLRRAFIQAGAESLVMSMWSVPDRETQELMVEFYRNFLVEKMSGAQALRQAALQEMKIVEKRYGAANPMFWGAFIYLGAE